jgi:hypothetical protein
VAKRDRQQRYKTTGAAADLIKVETLVPPEGREQILHLAAKLRADHRRASAVRPAPADVGAVVARLRELCARQPRRYTLPENIDSLVVTSVNVPFPNPIDAASLARAIGDDDVPGKYAAHLERFFGEASLTHILRFCDHHDIKAPALARFVRHNRDKLALHRPDLEEHLDALVPGS